MNIKDVGEFNLIDSIQQLTKRDLPEGAVGIGDDAAVLPMSAEKSLLVTTDMCLEGVHFDLAYFSMFQVGWKTMAANLSDIAAMGGKPTFAVVSLGLPASCTKEGIEELYKGMTALADQYQVVIVGGDTCASVDKLVVSITLLGEADKNRVVRRNTAKRQDMLCVTGDLGKSAAGMKILRDRRGKAGASKNYPAFMKRADDWQEVIAAHLEPKPRLKEVWALLEICTPSAMIDISDGLSSEVRHLCQGADLGAYLYAERVPVHIDAEKIARFAGMEPLEWALNGGEEYELLFTVPKEQAERVCSHIRASTGTEATVIGEMRPRTDRICLVDKDRRIVPLTIKGYDHFKKS